MLVLKGANELTPDGVTSWGSQRLVSAAAGVTSSGLRDLRPRGDNHHSLS